MLFAVFVSVFDYCLEIDAETPIKLTRYTQTVRNWPATNVFTFDAFHSISSELYNMFFSLCGNGTTGNLRCAYVLSRILSGYKFSSFSKKTD